MIISKLKTDILRQEITTRIILRSKEKKRNEFSCAFLENKIVKYKYKNE
jgi:hypothetical protein